MMVEEQPHNAAPLRAGRGVSRTTDCAARQSLPPAPAAAVGSPLAPPCSSCGAHGGPRPLLRKHPRTPHPARPATPSPDPTRSCGRAVAKERQRKGGENGIPIQLHSCIAVYTVQRVRFASTSTMLLSSDLKIYYMCH